MGEGTRVLLPVLSVKGLVLDPGYGCGIDAAGMHADTVGVGPWHIEGLDAAVTTKIMLGDARSESMQKVLNLKVKYRESFRPFAPSVLRDHVNEWFDIDEDSPYMLLVADVCESRRRQMSEDERALFGIDKLNVPRSSIPAVTHVDYSARVQTVDAERHGRYRKLLEQFERRTGCPVVINTSFNVRGEPIVCTPEDAYRCFMATNMDVLVVEDFVLLKEAQPQEGDFGREEYLAQFALD